MSFNYFITFENKLTKPLSNVKNQVKNIVISSIGVPIANTYDELLHFH